MHVWLVDLLRHHACLPGFPVQHSGWRPFTYHQRGEREGEGQGCRLNENQ